MYKKLVSTQLIWHKVVHIPCATYNFVPNECSKESAFFLLLQCDTYALPVHLLNLNLTHMGNEKSLLALDALRDIYALAIHNIKLAMKNQESQFFTYPVPEFLVRDMVLLRNHVLGVWDMKYDVAYCVA